MDDWAREGRLENQQDGRVYPIGRMLRSSFDADNHDNLDNDVTGLMVDLSKVPDAADPADAADAYADTPPPAPK